MDYREVLMKKAFICLCIAIGVVAGSAYADVLIVTNKDVPESNITQQDIKDIFLGKKTKWSNSEKIHFVLVKDPAVHDGFVKNYLQKSPSQFQNYWKNMVFTGEGKTPTTFESTQELIEYVSKTPGAVGYIDSTSTAVNVKTLNVE